jgi:hypothetical protein
VIDLSETYRHLGRSWTHEELASRYTAADRHGEQLLSDATNTIPERPIALLATAIPSVATLSVAVHLVHAIPESVRPKLADELLGTAETTPPTPCTAATEHSNSTATHTTTPPTSGSPSSTTQPRGCSSPRSWIAIRRPSSFRPRRRCAGSQARSCA